MNRSSGNATPSRSSAAPPSSPAAPPSFADPRQKLIAKLRSTLLRWKREWREGKEIVDKIVAIILAADDGAAAAHAEGGKGENADREPASSAGGGRGFSSDLQRCCESLADRAEAMRAIADDVLALREKMRAVAQQRDFSISLNVTNNKSVLDLSASPNSSALDNSILVESTSDDKVLLWFERLAESYADQREMLRLVAENIAHPSSADVDAKAEAVFHAAVWAHQPAIDQDCLLAEHCLLSLIR